MVVELEASQPSVVEEMTAACAHLFPIGVDGKARSARSGNILYGRDEVWQQGITQVFSDHRSAFSCATAAAIICADGFIIFSQPFCFEAPQAILQIVGDEPTGAIAAQYRRYIRTVVLPTCRRISDTLIAAA